MRLKPPSWWYGSGSLLPKALSPLGCLYAAGVGLRWRFTRPYKSSLPVICVGNLTTGGAGKTPTAIALAEMLKVQGEVPVFLTRGYGGKFAGPHLVVEGQDVAADVGDEPLLLARHAATVVCRDRAKGAEFIEGMKGSVIIMDDGFQNPTLHKDFSLIVIDAASGIGNGRVIPAGPLRAPLSFQLEKADAILSIGETHSEETALSLLAIAAHAPFFRGHVAAKDVTSLPLDGPVIAYCGIARPEKFFAMLAGLGAGIIERHAFADHYAFKDSDAQRLLERAKESGAKLITTEKDLARLSGTSGSCKKLWKKSHVLTIDLAFRQGDDQRLMELIGQKIAAKLKN